MFVILFTSKTKDALLSLCTKQAVLSQLYKSEEREQKEEGTEKKAFGLGDCCRSLKTALFFYLSLSI